MAALLVGETPENHTCSNFEEKNFQFLGNDGEVFNTAGYECVECRQFYTATGLEHLAAERQQTPATLMQDELPGLMGDDQEAIDLCLDTVDMKYTKQMFQTDPGQSEMDLGTVSIDNQYSLPGTMENPPPPGAESYTASESQPIKCQNTTAPSSVSMTTSDAGYLIGQPRVDYSQLLVGSSSTSTSSSTAVSNPIDLEEQVTPVVAVSYHDPQTCDGLATSSDQSVLITSSESASLDSLVRSSESVPVTATESALPPVVSSADTSEYHLGVSDIHEYFQQNHLGATLGNQSHEEQSNLTMSGYNNELGRNLEMSPVGDNYSKKSTEVTDLAPPSESPENYLQSVDNGRRNVTNVDEILHSSNENCSQLPRDDIVKNVSVNMGNILEDNQMSSPNDELTDASELLQPVSDIMPANDDREETTVSDNRANMSAIDNGVIVSASDNRGNNIQSDNVEDTLSSDNGKNISVNEGQMTCVSDTRGNDLVSDDKRRNVPVSDNRGIISVSDNTSLSLSGDTAPTSLMVGTNQFSDKREDVVETKQSREELSALEDGVHQVSPALEDGGHSGQQQHLVLERLIAELENSQGTKKQLGTKVLFLNSKNSATDTEVSITVSKELPCETKTPQQTRVIDLTQKHHKPDSPTEKPEKHDESLNNPMDEKREVVIDTPGKNDPEASGHSENGQKIVQCKPVSQSADKEFGSPRLPALHAGAKFKTITLYKCKFCNVRFFAREALEIHSYRVHADRMNAHRKSDKMEEQAAADGNLSGAETKSKLATEPNVGGSVKRLQSDQDPQKRLKLTVVRIKQPTTSGELTGVEKTVENTYLCYCGKKLRSVEELDEHRAAVHSKSFEQQDDDGGGGRSILCKVCDREFDSYQGLNAHSLTHTAAYKAKMSHQALSQVQHKQPVTESGSVGESPFESASTADIQETQGTTRTTTDAPVAVVRKLFMAQRATSGTLQATDTTPEVGSNIQQTVAGPEKCSTSQQPLVKIKTENVELEQPLAMISSVEGAIGEEQHINSSNLDLVGDLADITATEAPQAELANDLIGLSSLVLSEPCESSQTEGGESSRRDIERDILSITCIRCKKTYSCDDRCSWTVQCSACRWQFASTAHLQCHYDHFHLHDRCCPLCKFTLSRGSGTMMDRHFKTAHPNQVIYHCYLCETTFTTRACLGNHLSRHFSGKGDYECQHCHMRFEKAPRLNVHKVRNHPQLLGYPTKCALPEYPTLYMCGICGRQYEYEGTLRMHLRKHTMNQTGHVTLEEAITEEEEEVLEGQEAVEVANMLPSTMQIIQ